jgi:hypothetical protein
VYARTSAPPLPIVVTRNRGGLRGWPDPGAQGRSRCPARSGGPAPAAATASCRRESRSTSNDAFAKALEEGLEADDYAVTVAHTGEEGFYLAQSAPFDMMILDVMLPGRDGFEILARFASAA